MSESSPEADRADESIVGGSDSSIKSDIASGGTDGGDDGVGANAGDEESDAGPEAPAATGTTSTEVPR